jgi:hypothetical protein
MADPRQRTGRSVRNFAAAEQAFDTAARELVELTNAQGAAFAKMSFPTRRMTRFAIVPTGHHRSGTDA